MEERKVSYFVMNYLYSLKCLFITCDIYVPISHTPMYINSAKFSQKIKTVFANIFSTVYKVLYDWVVLKCAVI